MPEILKQYLPISAAASAESARRRLADDSPHLRRVGIQPAQLRSHRTTSSACSRRGFFPTGVDNGHEAPPIVVNGVMFVSTPGNQVIAIDAKTGTLLWRYRRPLPTPVVLLHPTSRGVAVYDDKVYFAAGEARARGARRKNRRGEVGDDRLRTTRADTTCRSRRSSPMGR